MQLHEELFINLHYHDGARDPAWGHDATELINGWAFDESRAFTVRAVDGYENQTVYCIEPGVGQTEDVSLSEKGEDYWNNYPSLNNTISPDDVKLYIRKDTSIWIHRK